MSKESRPSPADAVKLAGRRVSYEDLCWAHQVQLEYEERNPGKSRQEWGIAVMIAAAYNAGLAAGNRK